MYRGTHRPADPSGPLTPLLLALLVLTPLLSAPALANEFGRWWWEADVGVGQRGTDTSRDGVRTGSFDQTELDLSLRLHGFLLHPALGDFTLGLDLLSFETHGGRGADSTRTGFRADLDLLPRSGHPILLYAQRSFYDYSTADGSLSLGAAPEQTTRWGGGIRVQRGALRGLIAGFDRDDLEDLQGGDELRERQFLDWSGAGGVLQHHLRVERNEQEFRALGFGHEDLIVNLEQRAEFSPSWRWTLTGAGIQRDFESSDATAASTEDYRLSTSLSRGLRQERDQLSLGTELGLFRPQDSDETESRRLDLSYRWRPHADWQVAPFAAFARQTFGPRTVDRPQAGLSIAWGRRIGAVATRLSFSGSYADLTLDDSKRTQDESQLSGAFSGSLVHHGDGGWRKELEFDVARNELRRPGDPIRELPDLGLPRSGLGTEDSRRARMTLDRRWDSRTLSGWVEWNRRESGGTMFADEFVSDAYNGTAQLGGRRSDFSLSLGQTRVATGMEDDDQRVRFAAAHARWRPRPYLDLRALYRADTRRTDLAPDVDGGRYEVGLVLHIGQIDVDVFGFETRRQIDGGVETSQRGFTWSVRRRFAAWLPIVTGTRRRGVIR